MKLLFKQRFFSWFDSYDIYDESGNVAFTIKGQFSWGHLLKIYDAQDNYLGQISERVFTFLPKFEFYIGENYVGEMSKKFTFFKSVFDLNFNNWVVEGDFWGWEYNVLDSSGHSIMRASKEIFNMTDTYSTDVTDPKNALICTMIVLAIDAEKCSRD